jgi:hypothetical protein
MLSADLQTLHPITSRYAARYYLTGPDKDALIEHTVMLLAHDPDVLFEGPVEKAIALTMHRAFTSGLDAPQSSDDRAHSVAV